VRVDAPRDVVFRVFVDEIDGWWRRGKRFRMGATSTLRLEGRVGGRLVETIHAPEGPKEWDMGEVTAFEPPRRLVIAWRSPSFGPDDPSTEVEVSFERAIGHAGEGTLVVLEHRGWDRVRADHPVRHGRDARAFLATMGRFWGDLVTSLREHWLRGDG
jgi:uncharacterized protein YndB with AHSA1/START domain